MTESQGFKGLSLAQQIAQLEEPAPVDFDPEDIQPSAADPDSANHSAAREHYFTVGPSNLRKLHDSIADPKYDGVRTTRAQLLNDSGGDSDLPDKSDDEQDQDGGLSPEKTSEPAKEQPVAVPEPPDSTVRNTRQDDQKKGKAVARQIAVWDTLLDARIRLQKAVVASNMLPSPSTYTQVANIPECRDALNEMLEQAALLSNELFALQETLLTTNESIQPPPRKKCKTRSDDDQTPNYEIDLQEATQTASEFENAFHPYQLQTLAKWSAKIQAVSPSVLLPSNRNTFSSRSSQQQKSVVQHINETLSDPAKLLARTQIRRGKGVRIGGDDPQQGEEATVEIFDDTDYYQQLLKDVIDSRGDGIGSNDDWMITQKQKKAKKNVDTKASKGRKLRYEVHEKLQNFMVPVPVPGMWHEEQIDELFASLLGKGFENSAESQPEKGDENDLVQSLKGFRVFG